jgi:glycosyltransferase involved in cell wall biosynthesis
MTSNLLSLVFNIVSSFFCSSICLILARPQTVIISVPYGETGLGSYAAARLFRIKKVIIDYRDEWEDHIINKSKPGVYKKMYRYLKKFMTECYINSDLVVTTTERFADKLVARGVADVRIIANGADINIFKPYDRKASRAKIGMDEHDFVIIYSGTIGVYYRLDIVIRAMEKISSKIHNLKLLMVGRGSTKKMLDLAKEVGMSENVIYLGSKMDKIELAKIFSASDIGIIPYDANPLWKNSMPVKALEYLACGLPIIATVYGDSVLAELICENNVGLVAAPESVDSLALAIEKMYDFYCSSACKNQDDDVDRGNSLFTKEARERSASLVKNNFDRNEISKHFLTILENDCRHLRK